MIKYKTTPISQYIVEQKSPNANYKLTDYVCPLCSVHVRNRYFGEHVENVHALRKDEVYAKLFGLSWPARCACGKDLHYSEQKKAFPTNCGKCSENDIAEITYKNADDAHSHVEKLKELLAQAQAEEVRLKKEAELDKIPIEELPFPSFKYAQFMRRLSRMIRLHTTNGEKEKLFELSNMIDKKIA